MDENKLIKYESGQLQKAGNFIAITNKLHSVSERSQIIELLIEHPIFFVGLISYRFHLNSLQIEKYERFLDFKEITVHHLSVLAHLTTRQRCL